jgi:hypothetical protein
LRLLGGLRCIRNHGDTGPWNAPLLCNAGAPRQPVFLSDPLLKMKCAFFHFSLFSLFSLRSRTSQLICIKAAVLSGQPHERHCGAAILWQMRRLFPFPFNAIAAFTAASRLPPMPADFMALTAA